MHKFLSDAGTIVRVQTWDIDAPIPEAVEHFLGLSWSRETGTMVSGRGSSTVICLGPSEWLVLGSGLHALVPVIELDAAFAASSYRATDVSKALVRIQVTGNASCRLLGKGCSLDLDTGAFGVGAAARSRLAGIPAVIRRTGDFAFEVLVSRSYGEYLRAWLDDACLEFDGVA